MCEYDTVLIPEGKENTWILIVKKCRWSRVTLRVVLRDCGADSPRLKVRHREREKQLTQETNIING